MRKVGIVGLGKLGLPLALVFCKARIEVKGIDTNAERIDEIEVGGGFPEPELDKYLARYRNHLEVSTDYNTLKDVPVVFIFVQTPSTESGKLDKSYVESAVRKVHDVNMDALIAVSSTINIGDTDRLRKMHGKICYNPEFVAQGKIIKDFENPKFVLIGAHRKEYGSQIANTWRKIHNKPIHIVKPIEAEIIKVSLNFSYSLGITFANMIGELCEKFNADSSKVLDIVYKDRRNYKKGLGFMGPCFPRDVKCFKAISLQNSIVSGQRFSNLLNELNSRVVERYLRKIKSFGRKKIGILGVAYKPKVPYVYESQPLEIAERLLSDGYEISIYDPLAQERAKETLKGNKIYFCPTARECLEKAQVIFIGTVNYSNIKTKKPVVNPWV